METETLPKFSKYIKVTGYKPALFVNMDPEKEEYIKSIIPFETECIGANYFFAKLPNNNYTIDVFCLIYECVEALSPAPLPRLEAITYGNEQAGAGLNALQRFIQQNQPNEPVRAEQWREELTGAINFASKHSKIIKRLRSIELDYNNAGMLNSERVTAYLIDEILEITKS